MNTLNWNRFNILRIVTFCITLCSFCIFTDITERQELKTFFETNCSQIYFIFYENFVTLESNLKQKGRFCVNVFWLCLFCFQQLSCLFLRVLCRSVVFSTHFSIVLQTYKAFIWSGASNQSDRSDVSRNCDLKKIQSSAMKLIRQLKHNVAKSAVVYVCLCEFVGHFTWKITMA